MALTRLEQETTIRYNAEEDTCEIETANPFDIAYYDRLCVERPEWIKCTEEEQYFKFYECSKKSARLKAPKRVSEEQKRAMSERVTKTHAAKTLGNVGK